MDSHQLTLSKLHTVLLDLLFQIDIICQENNISYFLDSGSALGAVRHSGFIPWDDDIDVGMLREDYDRFIKVAPQYLNNNYFLLTRESDKSYKQYHAKLVRENSIFPEDGNEKLVHRGIYIDIFPFDRISDNRYWAKFLFITSMNITSLLRIKNQVSGSRPKYERLLSFLLRPCRVELLERLRYNLWTCYNSEKVKNVTCYLYKMQNRKRFLTFPIDCIWPVKDISFEGHSFKIMNNAHVYLKIMYNDYMKLPPIHMRETHLKKGIVFPND